MFRYKKLYTLNHMYEQGHDHACIFVHSYNYLYTYSSFMSPCPHVLLFKRLQFPVLVSVSSPCPVHAS